MRENAGAARLRLLEVNPTPGWRGGEAQTLLLCSGLAARGHEILLAAAPREPLERRAREAGIATRALRVRGDGDLFGTLALARIAAAFRPDLIHLHTSRAHAAGWTISLLSPSAPLVVSRRVDFEPGRNPLTRLKYTSRVARFLAVSGRVAEVLVSSGVERERVRTVYSGVPPRTRPDAARRAALRAELGIPEGAPIVGTVAAIAPHKDPLTLVRAAARVLADHPGAWLLLVGDGPMRVEVEAELDRLGIRARTTVAGFRADPTDCLALLDVFVASSHLEGLNTSVLDAMALGAPIVATRAGGIPELVVDGESGLLVPPRDPDALAAAVSSLLADRGRAARLAAAAAVRADSFTADRMVEETERIYREVIAERPERAPRGRPAAAASRTAPIRLAGEEVRHVPWFGGAPPAPPTPSHSSTTGTVSGSLADFGSVTRALSALAMQAPLPAGPVGSGTILASPPLAALRVFLLRGGWRDGFRGLLVSLMHGLFRLIVLTRAWLAAESPARGDSR